MSVDLRNRKREEAREKLLRFSKEYKGSNIIRPKPTYFCNCIRMMHEYEQSQNSSPSNQTNNYPLCGPKYEILFSSKPYSCSIEEICDLYDIKEIDTAVPASPQ